MPSMVSWLREPGSVEGMGSRARGESSRVRFDALFPGSRRWRDAWSALVSLGVSAVAGMIHTVNFSTLRAPRLGRLAGDDQDAGAVSGGDVRVQGVRQARARGLSGLTTERTAEWQASPGMRSYPRKALRVPFEEHCPERARFRGYVGTFEGLG